MIALDTNVLGRFLVRDDPEPTHRARRLLQETVAEGRSCYVSDFG